MPWLFKAPSAQAILEIPDAFTPVPFHDAAVGQSLVQSALIPWEPLLGPGCAWSWDVLGIGLG